MHESGSGVRQPGRRWPTVVALASFLACFGSFTVAAHRFFTRAPGERLHPRARLLLAASAATGMVHIAALLRRRPTAGGALVGASLYGGALLMFLRCVHLNRHHPLPVAFGAQQPDHLVREGPYRFIRHPIYAAYLLAWLAGPVTTGRPGMLACAATMGVLYHRTAQVEEDHLLHSRWGEEYRRYQLGTGMFLPRLVPTVRPLSLVGPSVC